MKIDGFNGKFRQEGGDAAASAASPAQAAPSRPVGQPSAAPPRPVRAGAVRSFGLKQAMSEMRLESSQAGKPEAHAAESRRVSAKDAFTAEGAAAALRRYAGGLSSDQALKVALTSHAPKVEGFVITLAVDNDFLLGRVNDARASLLEFLAKELNNGYITLNATVYVEPADGKEEKRLFTAKDKLDYFLGKNPAVAELKSLFNLELE